MQTVLAVLAAIGALTALVYGAFRFKWELDDRRREAEERAAALAAAEAEVARLQADRESAARERAEAEADARRQGLVFNLVDMEREARAAGYPVPPGVAYPEAPAYGRRRGVGVALTIVVLALVALAVIVILS